MQFTCAHYKQILAFDRQSLQLLMSFEFPPLHGIDRLNAMIAPLTYYGAQVLFQLKLKFYIVCS